jgi:hypothetical protein
MNLISGNTTEYEYRLAKKRGGLFPPPVCKRSRDNFNAF